ncbi:MAG TPA: DUF2955 domain-containing protein [Burkholderiales bacterium]
MPTSGLPGGARALDDPGVRRTLRLAIAVTVAAALAYGINWDWSFMAVALTVGLMITPMPAPSLLLAIEVLAKLYFWVLVGLGLVLPVQHMPVLGVTLVALVIFAVFYYDAQGKLTPVDSTLMMVAVLVVGMSGASIDTSIALAKGVAKGAPVMFAAGWIAYAILPAPVIDRMPKKPAMEGGAVDRALFALGPVLVVLPILIFLLASDNTTRYLTIAMKGVQVAEQANLERSRAYSADINFATIVGAAAGLVVYWLLKLWPSLFWYLLLVALSMLVFGWRMSRGPRGVAPDSYRWGYAGNTSIILLAPVLLNDDFTSDDPEARFYIRVFEFLAVTAYASAVLYVFDGVRKWAAARRKVMADL